MNKLWYKYSLIILLVLSCTNKNNINITSDENRINLNQEPAIAVSRNPEIIDINKILNSLVWNIDHNKNNRGR
jgi:hypothetical protein